MFLGIEIGGTKLQIVAGDAGGIVRRWRGTVRQELGGPGICEQLRAAISDLRAELASHLIRAAGVGFGGPIDVHTGNIFKSHQIKGWENFPLRNWLTDLLQLPVAVENDANVAAFGEAMRGAGKGLDPVFFCTLGSGVGGGISAGRKIYHGLPPGEVEFGHMLLSRDGATVESRCSGWAVDARIRQLGAVEPQSLLARSTQGLGRAEAKLLAPALAKGDAAAQRILRELAGDLAFALSHVVHLFHPQVLVLGGGLSLVGEPLRKSVAELLPGFIMKAFLPAPIVALPGLEEDSVPIGALELAATLVS